MSCLSCHEMHGADPNHMLKPGMQQRGVLPVHEPYRAHLLEHTRHSADSPVSLAIAVTCRVRVYSLLATHRSH